MSLPVNVQNEIINFLEAVPNINDTKGRQALIYSAGLDSQLYNQINFDEPPAQFFPLLLSTLINYGNLNDGRDALEAVLEVTKKYIGQNKQSYCDTLIDRVKEFKNEFITQNIDEQANEIAFSRLGLKKNSQQVFISYAREDEKIAKKLYNDLKQIGINVWLDKEKIEPGQKWKDSVYKAIKDSTYFLVLLSEHSLSKKGFVQKELKIALDIFDEFPPSQSFIIPIRLADCIHSDERLQELQWVDLFLSYENGLQQIIKVLLPPQNQIPLLEEQISYNTIATESFEVHKRKKKTSYLLIGILSLYTFLFFYGVSYFSNNLNVRYKDSIIYIILGSFTLIAAVILFSFLRNGKIIANPYYRAGSVTITFIIMLSLLIWRIPNSTPIMSESSVNTKEPFQYFDFDLRMYDEENMFCKPNDVCRDKTTFLPVLAFPMALSNIYSSPNIESSSILPLATKTFWPLYVHDRKDINSSNSYNSASWYQIGGSIAEPLGWIQAKDILIWTQQLLVSFTSFDDRNPVLIFEDLYNLKDIVTSKERELRIQKIYTDIRNNKPSPSLIGVESPVFKSIDENFYLLPVISFEPFEIDGVEGRYVKVFFTKESLEKINVLSPKNNSLTTDGFYAWMSDKDLRDLDIQSLEVRVLIRRRVLKEFIDSIDLTLQKGRRGMLAGAEFFKALQSLSVQTTKGVMIDTKDSEAFIESGSMSSWIRSLPYQSRILNMTAELWQSWGVDQQEEFLQETDAKLTLYQKIYEESKGWIRLNDKDPIDDSVYPLPLEDLP